MAGEIAQVLPVKQANNYGHLVESGFGYKTANK